MDINASAAMTAAAYRPPGQLAAFWAAFRENKGAMFGLVVITLIVLMAIFANFLAPYNPDSQFVPGTDTREPSLLAPVWSSGGAWAHILGTDADGRDILSRIIFGARISLFIGIAVMSVSFVIGIVLGLACAFFGYTTDMIITRIMDLIMAIPSLVLAILVVAVLGPSLINTIVAVTIVYLPQYVRLVRASAMAELTKDYVTAAKVAGVGRFRLMFSTVLPNCLAPLIVQAALGVSNAILEAAGLGFLGLGAQAPTSEWGTMLADAREFINSNPWQVTLPGLAILITVVSINLFGDGLRDALDPKMRRS
ncbi:ABC transporter permease subunit [Methylovirgula sp. 4M-Z18]|uniref:ABC transporter permease subunit n=1 Tax=Methylovirgula sp. 4M-Z18 TaxID=2293567 RepID=UPI000E2ED6AB|nr:ABC transporter permease subunit [Methylovirgula sp. 4M-Z18]RFB74972.1 ABC transporter permease subunit [Methylovirgula sp. 4M-Z18]